MQKIHDELKKAIILMPQKDKDKLLLRLIAKDKLLVEKLQFQLLEDSEMDKDGRAKEVENFILNYIEDKGSPYLTPGYLMMDMRKANAKITHHVKVTKDKFNEVYLTIILLLTAFRRHDTMLKSFPDRRSDTFVKYVIKRIEFIFKKLQRLNPDYFVEIEEPLNELLSFVHSFEPTAKAAQLMQFPKEWHY
jgi:hypothetical protein